MSPCKSEAGTGIWGRSRSSRVRVLQGFADPTTAADPYKFIDGPRHARPRAHTVPPSLLSSTSAPIQNPPRPHGGGRANPTSPASLMGPTVVARRKRGADDFLSAGDPFDLPRLMKRGRCSASATAADLGLSFPLESDPVEALQLIFPGADPQVRQRTCARRPHR